MKKITFWLVSALFCFNINIAQDYSGRFWQKTTKEKFQNEELKYRASHPSKFQVFTLNMDALKSALSNAPLRGVNTGVSNLIIDFPNSNGVLERFRIAEAPIMEAGLAVKFPMIKTYKATGIDDPTATMRFSITQFGLNTIKLSGKYSSTYIDPYTANNSAYMVYDRVALGQDTQQFECLTEDGIRLKSLENDTSSFRADINDRVLRTFRLAQTCNGEYGAIFDGTGTDAQKKANIQAQMAITVNRVNEVYERDLAITLIFIARNDELIYYNGGTDPWNGEFNTQTQRTISTTLNDESLYDIGHNFNTSGGGSAGCLGCVCLDGAPPYTGNQKGRGYTGRANPTGDPFDIDYVAHEMGHQLDGYHTMNTCSRSGNGTTEVEPASGSSIMGYAGICATNVQNNSDAHFNYVNIRDISSNIQPGGNSDCAAQMALTNQPPVANAGSDFNIPKSTAYVLKGSATDPDGLGTLTYNWSQNDPERAPGDGAPESTWTSGPLYRSILPTASSDRYMPTFNNVLADNLTPTWEVTPSVARTMEFALLVRDNGSGFANGIGQTHADLMTVTVEDVDPFTVNTPAAWAPSSTQTLTWNVGATTNGTINCQSVNIKISTDNGVTFTDLAVATANDGTEDVSVPALTIGSMIRVLVEANDNIFYSVTPEFEISNAPVYVVNNVSSGKTICSEDSVQFEFNFDAVNGYNENTTFGASGQPGGTNVTFTPASRTSSGLVTMEITGMSGVAAGTSTITMTSTASTVRTNQVDLTKIDGICPSVGNMLYDTSTTSVVFATINNPSAKPAGYSDYTGVDPSSITVTEVELNDTHNLSVRVNTDGDYPLETAVWIDWNQNCVLEASEEYYLGGAQNVINGLTSLSPVSVTVPADAVLGATIMRVSTQWDSKPGACDDNGPDPSQDVYDAEVEDYTVIVTNSLSTNEFNNSNFNVYPNPNNGSFYVSYANTITSKFKVTVFDVRGRAIYNSTNSPNNSLKTEVNLKSVQSGMYLLQIQSGNSTTVKKILIK
ncbi:reprolysin-like metallopeptidase [Aurantibacter sp.]|uniref:reprolysin-like metallopeptidase n=1 Tax=Aurantibacter sp. TaxID=2807103 RepID=UPI0035C7C9F4